MTDVEARQQVQRADHFTEQLRIAVTATAVDSASPCADAHRRGLQRTADTLDAVPFVAMCNLANLHAVMRGGLLELIEVGLLSVGAGDTGLCRRGGVPRRVRDRD